ncbi:hypothetical protein PBY51_013007 [Eleginops maclovinus]|uniref:E3 ubiquitin-protein ligase n=1 Tax=Eleginops maclovinus TaxID=56733 RepID=A0AAN8AXG7_ELEMC|nr:hypothetical protein PBY51_013007 [Eleginops maclovinus]
MSDNEPEAMEGQNSDGSPIQYTQPPTPTDTSTKDKDAVQAILSIKWSEDENVPLSKCEMVFQTWSNTNHLNADCKVFKGSEDDTVQLCLTPLSGNKAILENELLRLAGQTLQGKEGKTVNILTVTLTRLQLETQKPEASMNLPHSPDVDGGLEEKSSSVSKEEEKEKEATCTLSVGPFWYVSHIFKKEIERIEKENGVKISADVKITFPADKKDASPKKALSAFTSLVQDRLIIESLNIPLKNVDPEEWKEVMNITQRKGSRLLLTLTPEEMTSWGPSQSQDDIKRLNISTSVVQSAEVPQDTSPTIGMSIKDPLVNGGLAMEEIYWKLMTTSFIEQVAKIKAKFGVDFKESGISQGKVQVKVCYKRSVDNASMESHALRALLHLYQKIATSPPSFIRFPGGGFSGSPKNLSNVVLSEGASGGPVLNGASGNNTEAPTGRGATARDNEEDRCAICLDTFKNKKQLKCKHGFCEACLEASRKSIGPTCPICKDVFGLMEGDQPDGKMTTDKLHSSLPGFKHCSTIIINYDISAGTQTEKHPNPGKRFSSCHRTAYLPDNHEGREVLHLLKKAFAQKLIFTVGTSRTTGLDGQVTWNDIHHKTNMSGGPQNFGYPDPHYLGRVKDELKAKGIE